LRHLRNHPGREGEALVREALDKMENCLAHARATGSVDTLRGIEGDAAGWYFGAFDQMVLSDSPDFRFTSRSRRPPMDRINALLSYAYSILALDIASALESVGLDPYVGFLHAERPGRPSLALDLMEEFRAPIADRTVLSLVNLRQVNAAGFKVQPNGEVEMDADTRKTFLSAWQKRKMEEVFHPLLEEGMETGVLYMVQSRLLARHLRGDLEYYPAFLWK
jgi:CRISPR-associated protein Cas1